MIAVPFDRSEDETVYNVTDVNNKVVLQFISSPKKVLEDTGVIGGNLLSECILNICQISSILSVLQARKLNIKNYTFSKDCKLFQLIDGHIVEDIFQKTPLKGI